MDKQTAFTPTPLDLIYRKALLRTPGKTAIICGADSWTYGRLHSEVDSAARTLCSLGITRGDRILLCSHNRIEIAALYLACFRLGAPAVAVSCYSSAAEIAYAVRQTGARLLLVNEPIFALLEETKLEGITPGSIYCLDPLPAQDARCWATAAAAPPATLAFPPIPQDQPAVIIFTSGSTKLPKGVTHTHHSLFHMAVNRCSTLDLGSEDTSLNSGYLVHGAALTMTLLPSLYVGGTAVYLPRFNAEDFLQLLKKRRITHAAAGPSQLPKLLDHPLAQTRDFSTLRYFTSGGDAVPDHLFERFRDVFGFELTQSMGMTECGTYLTTKPGETSTHGTLGRPVENTEVRIVNELDREVPAGEIGQIAVRTEAAMCGYWNDAEATKHTLRGGWLYTGDLGRKDDAGFFYFAGRVKNIIVRDEGNIAPGEIEEALNAHPAVKESCVIGIPEQGHGEEICAFVVMRDPAAAGDPEKLEEELAAHLGSIIAQRKIPQKWAFLAVLPGTELGKVDRKELKKQALERWPRDTAPAGEQG